MGREVESVTTDKQAENEKKEKERAYHLIPVGFVLATLCHYYHAIVRSG